MRKTSKVKRAASDCTTRAAPGDRGEMVVAEVPQGYETTINVRLVPGRDVEITPTRRRCECWVRVASDGKDGTARVDPHRTQERDSHGGGDEQAERRRGIPGGV